VWYNIYTEKSNHSDPYTGRSGGIKIEIGDKDP